jgi:hypothetical protein
MHQGRERICVLGNSGSLLVMPHRDSDSDRTYPEYLAEKGFDVLNSSLQSAMISDMYRYLEDECVRKNPDHVVLNFGIVECTYRVRSRRLQSFFAANAWKNVLVGNGFNPPGVRIFKEVSKRLYRSLVEKPLFALGLKRRWLKPAMFRFILVDLIKNLLKDTNVRTIFFVGMPRAHPWLEREAPGTAESVQEYNAILKEVSNCDGNVVFLDPEAVMVRDSSERCSPDGIHFTSAGHLALAAAIEARRNSVRVGRFDAWKELSPYKSGALKLYQKWFR